MKDFLPYEEARDAVIKSGVVSSGSFTLVDGEMVTGKFCYRVTQSQKKTNLNSRNE